MKTLIMTGAAALLGMTALPAHAQTEIDTDAVIILAQADMGGSDREDGPQLLANERFYSPDRATYATWDADSSTWMIYSVETDAMVETYAKGDFDPMVRGWIAASADGDSDSDDITDLTQERYYSADRSTYAVRDEGQSMWSVFDAASDAVVDTFTDNDFDPDARGYVRLDMDAEDRGDTSAMAMAGERYYTPDSGKYVVWSENDARWDVYDASNDRVIGVVTDTNFDPAAQGWPTAAGELEDSDRQDITDLTGRAQERYYDADRATYGIYDPETKTWSVYQAENDSMLRTVPDNQFTRYEPGYTVMIPGDMQSSMSADTGSGANQMDSDRADPTDVTQ